jgi:hypothetical protein
MIFFSVENTQLIGSAMLHLNLPDQTMPRTIFWQRFLDTLAKPEFVSSKPNFSVPTEDLAIETNWPEFGNLMAAYAIGGPHDLDSVNRYLDKVVKFAQSNPEISILQLNMLPFFRVPIYLRKLSNIFIADGNLVHFERALNPRTISFPALPISSGFQSAPPSRPILASFQGADSHPVRQKLAAIADGERIVVKLVDRSNHVGKINALTETADQSYVELLQNSTFAFVPRGDANFSYCLLEVMSFGCIPVILSDGWVLPFDRTLRWDTFSLSFSMDHVPRIRDILTALSEDEILRRTNEVGRVYDKHFKNLDCIVRTLFTELTDLQGCHNVLEIS